MINNNDPLPTPSGAMTYQEFLKRNSLSKSTGFKLLRDGRAPKLIVIGWRKLVTPEAEREWHAQEQERAASAEAQLEYVRRQEHLSELGKLAARSPDHPSNKVYRRRKRT